MVASIPYVQMELINYYDQACKWLKIRHYVYNQEDKNIMERAVQYINKG
jgi:hypothetical protein